MIYLTSYTSVPKLLVHVSDQVPKTINKYETHNRKTLESLVLMLETSMLDHLVRAQCAMLTNVICLPKVLVNAPSSKAFYFEDQEALQQLFCLWSFLETVYFNSQMQDMPKTSSHVATSRSREHLIHTSCSHCTDHPSSHSSEWNSSKPSSSKCTNIQSGNLPCDNIFSATTVGMKHNLLMTYRVQVKSPNGSFVVARALLDGASSVSFISERLAISSTKQNEKLYLALGVLHKGHKPIPSPHLMFLLSTCPPK